MALALPGLDLIEEPRREHPNGQCSALAVVGRVNTDHVGMSGIEEIYDDHLSGESGRIVKEIGTDGTTIPGGSEQVVAAVPGYDIQVTLDRNVQYQAEQLLIESVENAGAERGIALVSVPSTGEIIAMANVDRGDDGVVSCTRQNLAATWSFEPGSIIKPITIAGVLTAELAGEHYPIPVEPTIEIYDHQFRDDPWHDVVDWTPTEIITNSSNVGTIKLAQLLGEEGLRETVVAFGLGTRTDLNFKGEANGIVVPLDEWSGLTLPNVAIGQGIAATPLQMLQAYNTIANDGVRVAPRLIIDETTPVDRVRVIDQATAAALERIMSAVVREGTGTRAAISGYLMAGKTGTAWQPCDEGYTCINENNEADGRHHTASFAGIVSNDHGPALTILVIIDEPQGETVSGGRLAAPVAAELAEYALRQLRIPAASGAAPGERQRAEPAQVPLLILPSADAEEDVT